MGIGLQMDNNLKKCLETTELMFDMSATKSCPSSKELESGSDVCRAEMIPLMI